MTNDLTKMSREELRNEFLLRDNNNMGDSLEVFDELARRSEANERLVAGLDALRKKLVNRRADGWFNISLVELIDDTGKLLFPRDDTLAAAPSPEKPAPVTDAEVEAAIDAAETAFRNDERVSAKLDALREVIARRVAEANKPAPVLHFVFDKIPDSDDGPRLIEVEDSSGRSVRAGEWSVRDDGLAVLKVPVEKPAPADPEREAKIEKAITELIGAHRVDAGCGGQAFPPGWLGQKRDALLALMRAPAPAGDDAKLQGASYDALGHAMEILKGTPYTGEMATKVAKALRQWRSKLIEVRAWAVLREDDDGFTADYRQCAAHAIEKIDRLLAAPPTAKVEDQNAGDAKLRELRAHAEIVRKERESRNRGGADDCYTDNARSRQRESEAIEWILTLLGTPAQANLPEDSKCPSCGGYGYTETTSSVPGNIGYARNSCWHCGGTGKMHYVTMEQMRESVAKPGWLARFDKWAEKYDDSAPGVAMFQALRDGILEALAARGGAK